MAIFGKEGLCGWKWEPSGQTPQPEWGKDLELPQEVPNHIKRRKTHQCCKFVPLCIFRNKLPKMLPKVYPVFGCLILWYKSATLVFCTIHQGAWMVIPSLVNGDGN